MTHVECRMKKYFQYTENMIPLFLAILKFCSTKHLVNIIIRSDSTIIVWLYFTLSMIQFHENPQKRTIYKAACTLEKMITLSH